MRIAKLLALFAASLTLGCEEAPPPRYEYGTVLADLELNLVSDTVGVYPDRSVLFDPNNPFRNGVSVETRFALLDEGPIAGFYAFASALANEPTGENQWYAANQLQEIHEQQLARAEDLALVRQLAIAGYQAVLDEFPGAVTFDATGRTAFDLMPLAVQGILDLGGVPDNGWSLVTGANGELIAVQSGGTP